MKDSEAAPVPRSSLIQLGDPLLPGEVFPHTDPFVSLGDLPQGEALVSFGTGVSRIGFEKKSVDSEFVLGVGDRLDGMPGFDIEVGE